MAYNNNKGPQHSGDIQFEGDPDETQIDFENDSIKLKTGGTAQLDIGNTRSVFAGEVTGSEGWRVLKASNRVGVTRGTLEEARNPLAIL